MLERERSSRGIQGILIWFSRAVGILFLGVGFVTFIGLIVYGRHFYVGNTEINLRDPLLVMEKTLAFLLLGFLFLGKGGRLIEKLSFLGEQRGVWLLTLFVAIIFVFFTLARYYACSMNAYDLTLFENSMYHIAYLKNFYQFVNSQSHSFSGHIFLILVPYAYLYRISGIVGVLIAHKILLSLTIPLAFLTAKNFTQDKRHLAVVVLITMFAPIFFKLGVQDLYPEALIFPLGLATFYTYQKRKWTLFGLSSLGLILIREDGGIVLGVILIYITIKERDLRWLFLSVISFLIVFGLMNLQTRWGGAVVSRFQERYGISSLYNLRDLAKLGLRAFYPRAILSFIFQSLGFGFLPWFSPLPLGLSYIIALPNVVSKYWRQAFLFGYYSIFLYPLIFIAVLETLRKIKGSRFIFHSLIALSFALFMGPRNINHRLDPGYIKAANEAISLIPPRVKVAATFKLASRLGGRPVIYVLKDSPSVQEPCVAPFVLIEETDTFYRSYWKDAVKILEGKGYREIYSRAGVRVFKGP